MSRFHPELNAFDIARMLVLGARDCLGELAASALAFVVSSPRVADWLIERAQRTPYIHIGEGPETYMYRYWLFNAYDSWTRKCKYAPFIKHSARIHEIMRPDSSRDHHDHPWDARTYILKGWYIEQREDGRTYLRQPGDTVAAGERIGYIKFGSRVDVIFGPEWSFMAKVGDKVAAGSTILARRSDTGETI